MTTATVTLPDDILCGMPEARLGRWQPLRAGIVGIFRYDVQEFVFYNGRLLFRGANGNGKSMALEVLLPYLLDADMSPERLSTFGGRSRGMYTWLLGHDKTSSRETARGYVWIEFGRLGDDGQPEYFTAGAGLEATRTSGTVTAWYFTTAARFGVQLPAFRRGVEPLNKDGLSTILSTAGQAGFPGDIRSPKKHREECNRVLFGLDDYKYEALRKALTQLRRPKLSDGLSEKGLADILRDSLAPLDETVIGSIADGYDRLDRHRANLDQLTDIRRELRVLERSYSQYARSALQARAKAVVDLDTATVGAEGTTAGADKLAAALNRQIGENTTEAARVGEAVSNLKGTLQGLKDTEEYREGKDLVPLLEGVLAKEATAKALQEAAEATQRLAQDEAAEADRLHTDADVAAEQAAAARADADRSAERAVIVAGPHGDVMSRCQTDTAVLTPADLDEAQRHIDDTGQQARARLVQLARFQEAGRAAAAAARTAAERREDAEEENDAAAAAVQAALELVEDLLARLSSDIAQWSGRCHQLLQGAPAPDFIPDTVEREVPAWLRRAEKARNAQLSGIETAIRRVQQVHSSLSQRLTGATESARQARTAVAEAATAKQDAQEVGQRWRQQIADWSACAVDLLTADVPALPPPSASPTAWAAWLEQARRARTEANTRSQQDLATRRAELREAAAPLEQEADALAEELEALESGTTAAPPQPHTRRASRVGRPGAPLYALVDFRDRDMDPARAALLEAAMIASGIADAWVSPDGTVLTEDGRPLSDTQLAADGPASASPASAALAVDKAGALAAGVDAVVVTAILDRITLADDCRAVTGNTGLIIGWNGSWRTAIAHGAFEQDSAYLIGAASRERARRRRMDAITARLTDLEGQLTPLRLRASELDQRESELAESLRRAASQAEAFPDATPMTAAAATAVLAEGIAAASCGPIGPAMQEIATASAYALRQAQRTATAARSGVLEPVRDDDDPLRPADNTEQWPNGEELLAAFERFEQATVSTLSDIAEAGEHANAALTGHRDALVREIADQPTGPDLPGARTELAGAQALSQSTTGALEKATTAENVALATSRSERDVAAAALQEAGLAEHADKLEELDTYVAAWHNSVRTFLTRLERSQEATAKAESAGSKAEQLTAEAKAAADKASGPHLEAGQARARYTALHERLSATFSQIEDQIIETTEDIRVKEQHLETLAKQLPPLHGQLGVATAKAEEAALALTGLRGQQPGKAGALSAACNAQLPQAAGWEAPPAQDATAEDTLALARFILQQADGRPGADLETAVNATAQARHKAEAALAGRLTLTERWTAGVFVVEGRRGGTPQTLHETAKDIHGEIVIAESLIERETGELLEQFLDADVRRQVTARIDAARVHNATMNTLLRNHGTSSGVQVMLDWVPDPAAEGFTAEIVDLLQAQFDASPSSKARLAAFFTNRIAALRAQNDGRPWRELLAEMLDYRKWYRYEIKYRYVAAGDKWSKLSSREHGGLSGGEKAVALHLPLFAAAATHTIAATVRDTTDPAKPGCPRLILLDEVFAGISEDNRGGLFDLVRKLNMDMIATSPEETGMYSELDGIAIYHLVQHQSMPGILAVRSVWDGYDSHDLLEADLQREGL